MPIYELDGQAPEFPGEGEYWVAETATLIGRVRLKREASVWFGAVLRGDNEWIELGERSQIQDNSTLHTDPGFPMVIGSNCVIGHNVVLHGCTIGDNSLIDMGAIMMNGVKIGNDPRRRRHLRAALAAVRERLEAYRLSFRAPKQGAAGPWGRAGRSRTRSGDGEGWGRDREREFLC